MVVLCLLICSPVQQNADTAFLLIQRDQSVYKKQHNNYGNKCIIYGLFPYLPCCTGQKCEVHCSLRHFEKTCLLHKTADAPSAGQSHSGTPFGVKSVIELSTNCQY